MYLNAQDLMTRCAAFAAGLLLAGIGFVNP
jgi:hypothetical protein